MFVYHPQSNTYLDVDDCYVVKEPAASENVDTAIVLVDVLNPGSVLNKTKHTVNPDDEFDYGSYHHQDYYNQDTDKIGW